MIQTGLVVFTRVSTHSRAEAAARFAVIKFDIRKRFQHTAARRRLQKSLKLQKPPHSVSTHSRAEAAAIKDVQDVKEVLVSTHSRAEAAASTSRKPYHIKRSFNTQPRGGGCLPLIWL